MSTKPAISRDQSLDARPVSAEIRGRQPLPDGGQRVTVAFVTGKLQRMILRLPDRITRDFELDSYGVEVLDMCDGRHTVKQMIEAFAKKHKLNMVEAEQALLTFLKTLIGKGVVSIMIPNTSSKGKK